MQVLGINHVLYVFYFSFIWCYVQEFVVVIVVVCVNALFIRKTDTRYCMQCTQWNNPPFQHETPATIETRGPPALSNPLCSPAISAANSRRNPSCYPVCIASARCVSPCAFTRTGDTLSAPPAKRQQILTRTGAWTVSLRTPLLRRPSPTG